ncbi:growth arrest-specific protein 2-like isoform X1 [Mya arenaria]|uniref:growth arrest-specific protein 2-like isoform X1 n=1 Tax=Mya arenaria TaxID=6604 RepID=UPI0022E93CED|nr:growth arrest-specific protein 2-like isoform X1 [Mya arenaria]
MNSGDAGRGSRAVGGDVTDRKTRALQEESLGPLRDDLADWIAKTLKIDVTGDTLMDVLDNGVFICDLATVIQEHAVDCVQQGKVQHDLPKSGPRCRRNAESGSWFARDNAASYVKWGRAMGMQDDSLFESEDLVSHKSERQVIINLLELARLGYKFGLEPPAIIKLEKEIDSEHEAPPSPPPPPAPVSAPASAPASVPTPIQQSNRPLNLDEEVRKMAAKCNCSDEVKRLREGMYMVFGKGVIIRSFRGAPKHMLLQNRHLMVRVGGGWDTLEHYLLTHNPVFTSEHRRKGSIDFLAGDNVLDGDKFLHIKAKYKSQS